MIGRSVLRGALAACLVCVASASAEELVLVARGVEGSELVVDLVGNDLDGVGSFNLNVQFDSSKFGPPRLEKGRLTTGGMVAHNLVGPGSYRIAVIAPTGVSGSGEVVTLRFPVRVSSGETEIGLEAHITDVNGASLPASIGGVSLTFGDGAVAEAGESDLAREPGYDEPPSYDELLGEPEYEASAEYEESQQPLQEAALTPQALDHAETADALSSDGPQQSATVPDAEQVEQEKRSRADQAARSAGYGMQLRFDPKKQLAQAAGPTEVRLRLTVTRLSKTLDIEPSDVVLTGDGVDIHRVRVAEDGPGLDIELLVDRESLPARLEARAFGLDESRLVPVYPQVDVDFDGSGDLTQRDYRVLVEAYGARKGMERYDERLDILPDGEIDDDDLVAFRFNLVHAERARRLKLATPESSMEQARP